MPINFNVVDASPAMMKELYMRTPLKKRPIRFRSFSPDETVSVTPRPIQLGSSSPDETVSVKPRLRSSSPGEKVSVKPRLPSSSPDGKVSVKPRLRSSSPDEKVSVKPRLRSSSPDEKVSVRSGHNLRPKKFVKSYAYSAKASEPAPNAMYVPVIKTEPMNTETETDDLSLVEIGNKPVTRAIAVTKNSRAAGKRKCTKEMKENTELSKQECDDFSFAMQLQKGDFNLRERRPKPTILPIVGIKIKRVKSQGKTKGKSAGIKKGRSSPKKPKKAGRKQRGRKCKRMPRNPGVNIGQGEGVAPTNLFLGSLQKMYDIYPELTDIIGQAKMSSVKILDSLKFIFLERKLYYSGKKSGECDTELSDSIFAEGESCLLTKDVDSYLHQAHDPR